MSKQKKVKKQSLRNLNVIMDLMENASIVRLWTWRIE